MCFQKIVEIGRIGIIHINRFDENKSMNIDSSNFRKHDRYWKAFETWYTYLRYTEHW